MPRFDGTGPLGKGPMTGKGRGFCIIKADTEEPDKVEGYLGLEGKPYSREITDPGSVNNNVSGSDTGLFNVVEEGGKIMPLGDRTGPAGFGPMTGRAAGYCAGYPVPGYMNTIPGRGLRNTGYVSGFFGRGQGIFGRGRGRGRGMGRRSRMWGYNPYVGGMYSARGRAPYVLPYYQ
jgi:hypothetical protein